jgi:hypothetical protein
VQHNEAGMAGCAIDHGDVKQDLEVPFLPAPAAVFVCLIIGYGVSLLTPCQQNDLSGLTRFDVKQTESNMRGGSA